MRAALGLAALVLLGGCAHDFGEFEPTEDGGVTSDADDGKPEDDVIAEASDGSPRDAASDVSSKEAAHDGPCTPSETCLDAAMSCGDGCTETQTTCEAACNGHHYCIERCQMHDMECTEGCVNTCTSCTESAGCSGAEMCQSAVGGGE
jgi:hypothetical protein